MGSGWGEMASKRRPKGDEDSTTASRIRWRLGAMKEVEVLARMLIQLEAQLQGLLVLSREISFTLL